MILAPLTAACLAAAAGAYRIPENYLYAILAVEGGRVGQAVPDKNGTSDLGPFQVNTRWGRSLAQYWSLPVSDALERVRDDGCANAVAASAILKGVLDEAHGDLATALGLYHSHSRELREPYRNKVLTIAESLKVNPVK
jgi:hypothetical protein